MALYAIKNVVSSSTIFSGRHVGVFLLQSADYASDIKQKPKTLEAKLGLPERPKKPGSPYFDFIKRVGYPEVEKMIPRPKLFKDIAPILREKWRMVDQETKIKLHKEFLQKMAKYPEEQSNYYNSLTEEQRAQLEKAKEKLKLSKQKRKDKEELKSSGKPERPATSFALYMSDQIQSRHLKGNITDLNKILSKEWKELSDDKKSPYVKKFKEAWKEYQTKMSSWEEEMVRQGKESLIRAGSRPVKMRSAGRPKSAIKEIKKSSNLHRG